MSDSPDFAAKNVFITGGLGFIGSNLARRLVDLGAVSLVAQARRQQLRSSYGIMMGSRGWCRITSAQRELDRRKVTAPPPIRE